MPLGFLFLVGGGETTPEMIDRFFEELGGKHKQVLVVALTREDPRTSGPGSVELLKENGVKHVGLVDSAPKTLEERRELIRKFLASDAIWIPGGDQNRLMERLGADWAQRAFRAAYERGTSFFGTSAGAMLMSNPMIGGNNEDGSPKIVPGLGLANMVIDSHYSERSRQKRLAQALETIGNERGIGLDEGKWMILRNSEIVASSGGIHEVSFPKHSLLQLLP